MSQIIGYKGDSILIEVSTYNYDYLPVTVDSAVINIYSVDSSGDKTYEVTDGNMIINGNLCTYMWTAPEDPLENDFIYEVDVTDSNGYTSNNKGQIVLFNKSSSSPSEGSGLSAEEHDWLHSCYAKTLNLSYDDSNYLKTDVFAVNNSLVNSVDDFKADTSNVGLKPEEHTWLESIYNTNQKFTFNANDILNVNIVDKDDSLNLGLTTEEHNWLENVNNIGNRLPFNTNDTLDVNLVSIDSNLHLGLTTEEHNWLESINTHTRFITFNENHHVNVNVVNLNSNIVNDFNQFKADISELALQDSLISYGNSISSKLDNIGGSNTNISSDIHFIKSIIAGNMTINGDTGVITHYDISNSNNSVLQLQLLDVDGLPTNLIGMSFGRRRV